MTTGEVTFIEPRSKLGDEGISSGSRTIQGKPLASGTRTITSYVSVSSASERLYVVGFTLSLSRVIDADVDRGAGVSPRSTESSVVEEFASKSPRLKRLPSSEVALPVT